VLERPLRSLKAELRKAILDETAPEVLGFPDRSGELAAGYAVDDGVALHFVNGKLENVVSSRPSAGALYLQKRNGRLEEASLSPTRLAAPKHRKTSQRRRASK